MAKHSRIPPAQSASSDPFHLERFVSAQSTDYARALAEIRSGQKRSHWMWYIFPQFVGLGISPTSQFYAIRSLDEARAYLQHPSLGPRLVECATAAIHVEHRSAYEIFGSPDDMKLHSCATLFAQVTEPGSVFTQLLAKYFRGQSDEATLRLIK